MKQTLYSISEEYASLMAAIEEQGGEITEQQQLLLQVNEEDYEKKLEGYAQCIANYRAEAAACKEQADHFAQRAKSAEAAAKRLNDTIVYFMDHTGRTKESVGNFKFSIRSTEAVNIVDEEAVPKMYKVVKYTETISKTAIKEAIKGGEDVPGAEVVTNHSLTIR